MFDFSNEYEATKITKEITDEITEEIQRWQKNKKEKKGEINGI